MKNFKFKIDDSPYTVDIVSVKDKIAKVNVNGVLYEVEMEQEVVTTKTPTLVRQDVVPSTDTTPASPAKEVVIKSGNTVVLRSPLPGKILDIMVKPGEAVSVGQTVACIEAMKMENNINSDKQGVVTAVCVSKGDTILEGVVLIEIG
jgi:biotin carboxyl carrier protein